MWNFSAYPLIVGWSILTTSGMFAANSKIVGVLYRLRDIIHQESLVCPYYSLFYRYLIYGNLIWVGIYSTHLNNVELLQKRAVRIVTGSEYLAHTEPLCIATCILKVKDIHKVLLLLYYHKNKSKFPSSSSSYDTMIPSKLKILSWTITDWPLLSRESITQQQNFGAPFQFILSLSVPT